MPTPCSNAGPIGPRPTVCCFLDGRQCCEYWIDFQDEALAEELCIELGGCFAGFPSVGPDRTCESWGCPAEMARSCCDLTTGLCTVAVGGITCNGEHQLPSCPVEEDGCPEEADIECAILAAELHACCIDEPPFCVMSTYADCATLEGDFAWNETECSEFICEMGCREPLAEPFTPTSGEEWGQKTYTLDLCYPASMVRVRPPQSHGLDARRGRGVPMTVFEVRNVAQFQSPGGGDDPCARAYGVLARDERGRRRPYLCSQIDPNVSTSATYSQGYFSKSLDDNGPILRGRRVRRVGVMAEPHREVQYRHKQWIRGIEL